MAVRKGCENRDRLVQPEELHDQGGTVPAGAFMYAGHVAAGRERGSGRMANVERHERGSAVIANDDLKRRRDRNGQGNRHKYDDGFPSHCLTICIR